VIRIDRWQPPVALFAAFPRNQSGGALATESRHQSFHLPIAQTQCVRCGRLGHSMFHNLLEYLQPIQLGIAHREVSLHRRTCKMAQKGTFLLGGKRTFLFGYHTIASQSWYVGPRVAAFNYDIRRQIQAALLVSSDFWI